MTAWQAIWYNVATGTNLVMAEDLYATKDCAVQIMLQNPAVAVRAACNKQKGTLSSRCQGLQCSSCRRGLEKVVKQADESFAFGG